MKRAILLLGCLFLLVLTASGCAQPVRSAQIVKDDLLNSTSFYGHTAPDVLVTDFKIVRRSQDAKTKTEYVRVAVNVEGPDGSGELHYMMTYVSTSEGWVLNTIEPDAENPWKFTPTKISSDDAEAILQEKFGENYTITGREDAEDKMAVTFTYSQTSNSQYMDQDINGTMSLTFDTATALWGEPTFTQEATPETWKVTGDWSFLAEIPYYATNDATIYHFTMKITSFDGKTCAASYNILEEFRDNGVIYSKSESGLFESLSTDGFYYEIENNNGQVYAFSIDKDKGVVVRFPDASGPCRFTP